MPNRDPHHDTQDPRDPRQLENTLRDLRYEGPSPALRRQTLDTARQALADARVERSQIERSRAPLIGWREAVLAAVLAAGFLGLARLDDPLPVHAMTNAAASRTDLAGALGLKGDLASHVQARVRLAERRVASTDSFRSDLRNMI